MFLTLCVPFTMYSYAKPWPFPDAICYLTIYLQYVTAYASVWTLVILALDRFLVSCFRVGNAALSSAKRLWRCAILCRRNYSSIPSYDFHCLIKFVDIHVGDFCRLNELDGIMKPLKLIGFTLIIHLSMYKGRPVNLEILLLQNRIFS